MNKVPPRWRKSSRSAAEADCVEVEGTLAAVRDTKNPRVELTVDVRVLMRMIRQGELGI
jgi:hypothetical protein